MDLVQDLGLVTDLRAIGHDDNEGFGVEAERSHLGLDLDQRPVRPDVEGGQRVRSRDDLVSPVDPPVGEQTERRAGLELVDAVCSVMGAVCHRRNVGENAPRHVSTRQ